MTAFRKDMDEYFRMDYRLVSGNQPCGLVECVAIPGTRCLAGTLTAYVFYLNKQELVASTRTVAAATNAAALDLGVVIEDYATWTAKVKRSLELHMDVNVACVSVASYDTASSSSTSCPSSASWFWGSERGGGGDDSYGSVDSFDGSAAAVKYPVYDIVSGNFA